MQYNERYFKGLDNGLYLIAYTSFGTKIDVFKKEGDVFLVMPRCVNSRPHYFNTCYDIVKAYQNDLIHYIKPLKFEPENSEYAGNSRSGQSAGTDLIPPLNKEYSYNLTPTIYWTMNKLIERVNELSKPSETNHRSKS